jgi:hypothetical protein
MDMYTGLALVAGLLTFLAGVARVIEHARTISRGGGESDIDSNDQGIPLSL